jgi:hypothetical protein
VRRRPRATLALSEQVLREAGSPLRVVEIVARAGADRVRLYTRSLWPYKVVARDLAIEVRDNPDSAFVRVAKGVYSLRAIGQLRVAAADAGTTEATA